MKKFIFAVVAFFASLTANAATSGISDVQPKGGFNFAINVLEKGPAYGSDPDEDGAKYCFEKAMMPMMGIEGNWVITSGMFNAGKFGQNGSIDLGFKYDFCPYKNKDNKDWGGLQNVGLVRCAFHFEFVPKLDVYAGVFSGVNVESPRGADSKKYDWSTTVDYSMGMYIGAKYFFTDNFGLKTEFGSDFVDCGFPPVSFGLAFKF